MSESAGAGEGERPPEPPPLSRLDPERAAAAPPEPPAPGNSPSQPLIGPTMSPTRPPVIDTRPYRWMIGIIGLVLVLAISAYQFFTHGVTPTGVLPGHRLHLFAAPLADTNLNGDPNAHPTCTPGGHDPRALNICLLAARGPLVLSLFVTGASQCEQQVSALQTLSRRFPRVQFAAVAIGGGHATTAADVRRHGWTIPVAYDRDGTVQQLYGVLVCPMVEMAYRGGVVRSRLIGERWQSVAELAPYVQGLADAGDRAPPG